MPPFLNNKAKGILGFLEGMRSRLLDQSYNFLFRPVGYSPALNGLSASHLMKQSALPLLILK